MHHIPRGDILHISINTYKMLGEYMKYNSFKLNLYRCCNCSIFLVNIAFTLISLGHLEGGRYMKTLEGGTTALHVLLKYLGFLYYKRDIEALYDAYAKFWLCESLNRKLYTKINANHRIARNIQIFIVVATTCIMTVYCLRPILSSKAKFIFEWWIPGGSVVLETLALFSQYYFTMLVVPVVFAYDSIYLSYSMHMISQLKLLNFRLERMAMGVDNLEIYRCIRHHQFLLA
ncbi:hypothetical protein Trydic_g3628 [Trypoxylus dichotomus]